MPVPNMPPCPPSLKAIQHYLTIASEHDSRDIVISYWCRLYALQQGLKIDKSTPEAKKLLFFLMDWLEAEKAKEKDNEAIIHDIPAQAHLENYALKLFQWADQQDRAAVFNKNVIKAFYTSGMIFSVLESFGELPEDIKNNQKYAKWKAAYIHDCLKKGEVPVPGPMGGEGDEEEEELKQMGFNIPSVKPSNDGPSNSFNTIPSDPVIPNTGFAGGFPAVPTQPAESTGPVVHPGPSYPAAGPSVPSSTGFIPYNIPPNIEETTPSTGFNATPEMTAKALKLCKFATSALNFDDVPTALVNLKKAYTLLTTGKEE